MKRYLIPSLVLVHLLLHALALWMPIRVWQWDPLSPAASWRGFALGTLCMLGFSQGALLAIWIALGERGTLWRVALAAVGTVVYLACFHDADEAWLAAILYDMEVMVVLLLCARLMGLELTRSGQRSTVRPRFQFFIREILAWTTALAVVLSAGKCLFLLRWYPILMRNTAVYFVWLGTDAILVAAFMWAALGQRRTILRVILPPVAVVVAGALFAGFFHEQLLRTTIGLGFMAFWIVASLLVVRWAGYRLTWQWRFSRRGIE
jgi:hypothetical protein